MYVWVGAIGENAFDGHEHIEEGGTALVLGYTLVRSKSRQNCYSCLGVVLLEIRRV